ncbi:Metallo-hydrolase/oxidoreductase, partial [Basidiobolus meristosporus CBS 931.73]
MKYPVVQAITLSALFLSAFGSPKLKVIHHSSSDASMYEVSTAVIGQREVVILDAGFTRSSAQEMISLLKNTTKLPVTKIFATHEHPDHYFGATEILKAYPKAGFYASPSVVKKIKQHVDEKVKQWTGAYAPGEIPQAPRIPKPFRGKSITLGGNKNEPIKLLQPFDGDVEDVTAYWIPSQKTLITGDMVYSSRMHVWLSEAQEPSHRKKWIRSLDYLIRLKPKKVIAGHVPSTEKPQVSDLRATKEYIEYFDRHVYGKSYTAQKIYDLMKKRFPNRIALETLNLTASAYGHGQ